MSLRSIAVAGALCLAPLFAAVVNVSDFGAKGDGRCDDGPAIQRAVEAAVAAPRPTVLRFEKRAYRIGQISNSVLISLNGVTNLAVAGNGATILNSAVNGTVEIRQCSNVSVGGFVLECDPLSWSQGTLTSVDASAGRFELSVSPGYLNWDEELRSKRIKELSFGMFYEGAAPQKKTGPNSGDHFRIESSETLAPGKLRVTLQANYRRQLSDLVPGDRMVVLFPHGGHGPNFSMLSSAACALEDIIVYSAKYGMTFAVSHNVGQVALRRIAIRPKPGTDRLLATPRDGMHCKHNRVGPLIEGCHFEGLLDDSINVSATPYWVKKVVDARTCIVSSGPPRVGDRLLAYNPSQEQLRSYRVTEVAPGGEGEKQKNWWRLGFAEPIVDFVVQPTDNEFPGGSDKLKVTGLYNLDACGAGFVIRSNHFGPQRRYAVLARASGTIEDNTMGGCGGSAMNLGNEIGSFYEGPFPERILIQRNRITDVMGEAISVYSTSLLREPLAHDIVIRDNEIRCGLRGALSLVNVSNAAIIGNRITLGAGVASNQPAILLDNCRLVQIEANQVSDPRGSLAAVVGRSTWPADVRESKNTMSLAQGVSAFALDVPPPSGLLMPKKPARVTVALPGKEEIPLEKSPWSQVCAFRGTVALPDGAHLAYEVHPPFGSGVASSSIYLYGEAAPGSATEFSLHAAKRSAEGDGVEVSLQFSRGPDGPWEIVDRRVVREASWSAHRAPLKAWQGPKLHYRIEVNSRANTAFDATLLGDVRLVGQ